VNNFPVSDPVVATFTRVYAIDDGVPNIWREQFFGPGYLTDPRVSASADPDGDGANNLQEYLGQTNPLDPLSGFGVQIRTVPLVSWNTPINTKFRVLRTSSLGATNWVTVVPSILATNSVTAFIDSEAPSAQGFYVVQPLP
jgi:hypothetical protein